LSGCAFRCQYCHNPDTWKLQAGEKRSVRELVRDIAPYREFLKRGGGVTVSGGEPLVQADFVREFFGHVKAELGLHTCLDTNGYLSAEFSDEWFACVDLVLLDIKHIHESKHKALTGFSNAPVLAFAKRLDALQKPFWIRHVLVPGLTDAPEDLAELATFLGTLTHLQRVEILPFHQLGASKWQAAQMPYPLQNTPACSPIDADLVRAQWRARGLPVA
jgi:pyruvate formate lyase activating enzyme